MYVCSWFLLTHTLWQLFSGSYTYVMPLFPGLHVYICVYVYILHVATTCHLKHFWGFIWSLLHVSWPICVVFTHCSFSHPDNRSYIYTHIDLLDCATVECSHASLKQASIHTHQCTDTSTHARTYLHNHACIHTYIHTYKHTFYIHTHRHNSRNR